MPKEALHSQTGLMPLLTKTHDLTNDLPLKNVTRNKTISKLLTKLAITIIN